jgi:MFS family permease
LNEECFVADVVENKVLAYLWYVWLPTDSAEEARKEVVSPAHRRQLAASWMVTAVVGGAILPYFMGLLADRYSMRVCLLMPLGYFAFIAFYGFGWQKLYRHDMEPDSTSATVPPH